MSSFAIRLALLLFAIVLMQACRDPESGGACSGQPLFGRPNAMTGLGADRCQPGCACSGNTWTAPDYGETDASKALAWTLIDPPAELTSDPYAGPAPAEESSDTVCGVLPDAAGSHNYRLVTYDSETAARDAGAFPTHFGACGLCSPLADLAVYMRLPDLTAPVRQCGLAYINGPAEAHLACLMALGFDRPCAQIWYYNTLHTREHCFAQCMNALNEPYNQSDGSLNECLACDEEQSGAIFKAVAGRTRRNTGIASAICRPCDEARPLLHDYL